MARDLKLVQRGVNVQANDLAVPPGTPLRAQNIDFQRDGVAARRAGFERFDAGIPWTPLDPLQPALGGSTSRVTLQPDNLILGDNPETRGIWELFARDHAMTVHGGFAFSYDEFADEWMSVPVAMSHRFAFFGTIETDAVRSGLGASGLGRAVGLAPKCESSSFVRASSPLSFQTQLGQLYGTIGNRASEAAIATSTQRQRFGAAADVVDGWDGTTVAASDSSANVIWKLATGAVSAATIMAGSLTASGATDGTGAAATFSGPSWMCAAELLSDVFYVADNTNMIRKVQANGVVTTLAGSITAGDSDGYFAPAAAQWTQHNASSSANWGSIAYSSTLGSGSGRLCAIETSTATTKAMTSDDGGATWTARTLPTSRTWMSVTWAAGLSLFVAVAQDGALSGRCATSPDGITWTSRTTPDGAWASVAWSSSLSRLVAVGLSTGPSYAMTSTNGTSWTTSGVTQVAGYWVSVVSAGALGFVALGQFDTGSGQVMVASTGLNWSVSGVSVPEANQWMSVTYSSSLGRLVAVSQDGTNRVMTSTNGTSWTAVAASAANLWSGVCWADAFDVFIAVSQDGTNRIMYSSTGTGGWTGVAAPDTNQWFAIVDAPEISRVVSTALGVLDAVMRATTSGATVTGALFRTISGLAVDSNGGTLGYLYVAESAGNRIRRIDLATGVVSLLAGSASAASGYTDGTGAAARFNTPVGIEIVHDGASNALYVGDTLNWRVRKVTIPVDGSDGVVTTYAGTGTPGGSYSSEVYDGIVGGASPVLLRSKIRGKYKPGGSVGATQRWYLVLECDDLPRSTTSMDVALLPVTSEASEKRVFHIARSPDSYPDGASGPNKLDTMGPNVFALAQTRGVDCGNGAAFTTSERPHMIDAWTRTVATDPQPRLRPLGLHAPMAPSVTAVAGTTFAQSMTVAYRVVMGLNLPDGRIAIGPPSERIILAGSTTATWAGSITAYPAPGLAYDGQAFLQLYRTRSFSITVDPGDQMFLCYEAALTYGSGLAIADVLPDDLLGAELYTNATEDGVAATALPPPTFATEIASFNNRAVVGNYVRGATLRIKVLGVSSLVAGTSTITLRQNPYSSLGTNAPASGLTGADITFTAIAGATNPAANQFQIASGGTATQNAAQTARNIVACINRSPDAMLFTAQYDESEPGSIVVTSLWPGSSRGDVCLGLANATSFISTIVAQSTITFSTNAATSFQAAQQALSARTQNAMAYSEQGAYDSFPIVNEVTIGHGAEGIVRALPLSDVLIAVKDDSVWSMDSGFEPRIYDKALSCQLADSFAMVNNQWIGLFTRGFVSLGASQGVALGRPIDRDVSAQYGNFRDGATTDQAQAAAIDLSGNYLCVFNRRAYVYNVVSQCWSEWSIDLVAGDVSGGFEPTAVGAYLDSFLITQNGARAMLQQRRSQRDGTDWYKDFADPTYSFGTATLAADLTTMTVAAYDAEANAAEMPPIVVDPPAGAVASASNDAAAFWWVFSVTQGSITVDVPGVVAVANPASATSALTITLAQALTGITAGSVTVSGYPPVICRVQYAPFAAPGSNAGFGDVLATIERCQPGYMIARFFGRQDYGDATDQPIGWYGDAYGVSRAKLMPSITASNYGIGAAIAYENVQRFPTPRERAVDQTLGLELWEGVAWQPLAIKAVTLDKGDKDNTKVVT